MKKLLLLAAISVTGLTAWGEGFIRQVAPDLAISHISPNGRYVVSELYGYLEIFDLENGTKKEFYGDENDGVAYGFGMGNSIADNGIGVGSTTYNGNACVYEDGTWTELPVPYPERTNLARGITPDARRICGTVGMASMSISTTSIMSVPCVWNRQDDGTYAGPVYLPHPDLDFTGRVPQYITAIAISDDGRTIAGQIRDYSGFMIQPIVYREDEKGEWSYEILFPELSNPDGIVLPEDPGDAPQNAPNMQDFMTPQELEDYNLALSKWEMSGGTDWANYPDMESFMTQEELDAFNAAVAAYDKEVEEWMVKYRPFQEALNKIMATGSSFLFNTVFLSPDGKVYASCTIKDVEDPTSWSGFRSVYCPVFMDLEKNELRRLESEESMIVSCVTADYTVLANTAGDVTPKQAYISLKGESEWVRLDKWLDTVDPEVGDWFTENASHTVDVVDPDGMPAVLEDYVCSGVATCTPDMTLFATYSELLWDSMISNFAESYIFTVNTAGGVKGVEAVDKTVDTVRYFSLDGKQLPKAPEKGLTIRQTIFTDGTVSTEKVIL